jgi:hypothetical protein
VARLSGLALPPLREISAFIIRRCPASRSQIRCESLEFEIRRQGTNNSPPNCHNSNWMLEVHVRNLFLGCSIRSEWSYPCLQFLKSNPFASPS